jgi:hypothetical protein
MVIKRMSMYIYLDFFFQGMQIYKDISMFILQKSNNFFYINSFAVNYLTRVTVKINPFKIIEINLLQ